MQNKKLALLFIVLSFLLCGCSLLLDQKLTPQDMQSINQVQHSKFLVLDVYHNRCDSCKSIEPVVEKLKADYSGNSSISFLKYDLSNPFTIFKSRKIAKELGLENIYKAQRYSGVVLFIDLQTKQVLDTLIGEYNIERYNEVIGKRL